MYRTRPDRVFREPLAPGAAGVKRTLELMRQLVQDGKQHVLVRNVAGGVLRDSQARPTDDVGEARALLRWVADHIRYTRDIEGVETLQAPWITIAEGIGDCDDKSTLLAAMLKATGNRAQLSFRAIGTNPTRPGAFGHVYLVARMPGGVRMSLDPTREGTLAGWEFPRPTVAMEVPI